MTDRSNRASRREKVKNSKNRCKQALIARKSSVLRRLLHSDWLDPVRKGGSDAACCCCLLRERSLLTMMSSRGCGQGPLTDPWRASTLPLLSRQCFKCGRLHQSIVLHFTVIDRLNRGSGLCLDLQGFPDNHPRTIPRVRWGRNNHRADRFPREACLPGRDERLPEKKEKGKNADQM